MESSVAASQTNAQVDRERQLECVRAVRSSLTASYPGLDVRDILRIVQTFGFTRLPAALMLDGDAADRSKDGLAARLRQVSDPNKARTRDPHVLFSTLFYDFVAPTVRSAGVAPWLHYQVFGREEGRSPHVLLDIDYLAQSVPTVRRENLIDHYLSDRESWFLLPSPYVSIEKFLLSGEWSGQTNPLVEILTSGPQWLQPRLMVVDSAWGTAARARATGIGYLLTLPESVLSTEAYVWSEVSSLGDRIDGPAEFTVIPGYFVGLPGKQALALSERAISADNSALRLEREFVSLRRGRSVTATTLRVPASDLDATDVAALVRDAQVPTVLAPHSVAQELALKRTLRGTTGLQVEVLRWGVQTQVTASDIRMDTRATSPVAEWVDSESSEPHSLAVVVGPSYNVADDLEVIDLLERGAALCVLSDGIEPWLPALGRASIVIAQADVIAGVLPFIDRATLRVLPGRGRAR